jgi:hypothetical protein
MRRNSNGKSQQPPQCPERILIILKLIIVRLLIGLCKKPIKILFFSEIKALDEFFQEFKAGFVVNRGLENHLPAVSEAMRKNKKHFIYF